VYKYKLLNIFDLTDKDQAAKYILIIVFAILFSTPSLLFDIHYL